MIDDKFIQQYDKYIDYCILKCNHKKDPDCKQEVYLILCENNFDHMHVKAYIFKIVKNYYLLKQRKKEIKLYPKNVTISIDNHLIYKEAMHKVSEIRKSDALQLFVKGYKYKEIAKILKVSIDVVRSRIYRVRRKLNGKVNR